MKKNNVNNNEIISVLNSIKIVLYLILVVLVVNTVLLSVSMNKDTNNNEEQKIEEEIPEYDVSEFKSINFSDFEKLISLKGTHVIYIGREACSYCAMFIPTMKEAQEKYEFKTNYFDISSIFNFTTNTIIDQKAFDKMSTLNDFFEENILATPMIVIYKDGKFVDGTMGYQSLDEYSKFLENNGFK